MSTDWWSVRSMRARSLELGGLHRSLTLTEVSIAGNCEKPVIREQFARPEGPGDIIVTKRSKGPQWVRYSVRCRVCNACLRARAKLWAARALQECAADERTWFVTLTLRPEEHYRALAQGLSLAGVTSATDETEFTIRVLAVQRWLTLALKRLRKNTGARIRYLACYEKHASGLPHLHMILHEREGSVRKQDVQYVWTHGFSNVKLLKEPKQVWYACKYLGKSKEARVRASLHYGKTPAGIAKRDFSFAPKGEIKTATKKCSLEETFS